MITSPPLVITEGQIAVLITSARKSLDKSTAAIKADGLMGEREGGHHRAAPDLGMAHQRRF
jgi:hypothetical protein